MIENRKPSTILLVLSASVVMWSVPSVFSGHFLYRPAGHHLWGGAARMVSAFLALAGGWGIRDYIMRLPVSVRRKGCIAVGIPLGIGTLITVFLELSGVQTYNGLAVLIPAFVVFGCIHSLIRYSADANKGKEV